MLKPNVELTGKTILVTGAAGFIGSNLVLELLKTLECVHIVGLDNVNDYYDVSIKEWRLKEIETEAAQHAASSWTFIRGSIADRALVEDMRVSLLFFHMAVWGFRLSQGKGSQGSWKPAAACNISCLKVKGNC